MNPTNRIQIISRIALNLQEEYNTTEINMILSGYNIPTENISIVKSKRVYVINLLKSQPNELIVKIAKDLHINLPEEINIVSKNVKTTELGEKKIFISHSSLDIKIVEKVIDVLEAIGVPSNKIFCSSFEGYGVKLGSNFLEVIRKELDNNVLVLFILSSNFYKSVVSLCEMGATWVKTNIHIPILIPPFEYDDIKGVIPTTHGMKINEKAKLNSLKDIVAEFIGLQPPDTSVWERRRDNILIEVKKILDNGILDNMNIFDKKVFLTFSESGTDTLELEGIKRLQFPSNLAREKIQKVIETKVKAESTRIIGQQDIIPRFGSVFSSVPYEQRSIEELKENLKNVEETYSEEDVYYFYEKISYHLNFLINNDSEKYIEDCSIEFKIDKTDYFKISSEVYENPEDNVQFGVIASVKVPALAQLNYPQVKESEEKYFIQQHLGDLKHKIPTEVFDEPLRIVPIVGQELNTIKIEAKVYGKNLSNPIERKLTIKIK